MAVDSVEEVGITTDTSVAGIDIGQLGLPSTITDLLSAANSYGKLSDQRHAGRVSLLYPRSTPRATPERSRGQRCESCNGHRQELAACRSLTSQLASGLSVKVYGTDAETLTALSEKVLPDREQHRWLPECDQRSRARAMPPSSCR